MLQNRLCLLGLTAALSAPMIFAQTTTPPTPAPSCGVSSTTPFGSAGNLTRVVTLQSDLSSLNENPAVTDHSGSGTLLLMIRLERTVATSTTPTRALVDAQFTLNLPQAETVTAAHIHSGAAGANGDVVLPLNPTRFDVSANTPGMFHYQAEITDQTTLNSILAIVSDPQSYYANVHTVSEANGIMRGQLHYASNDQIQCLQTIISSLATSLTSVQSDLTGVAAGASSVVSTVGSIRTDITALKASVAALQADVTTIKNNTSGGTGGTGGTGGGDTNLTAITQNLTTTLRLIVQIAYTQGVIGSADRDALLMSLK